MAMIQVLAEREGGRSLCSTATLERLEREARALFSEMAEDPPAVGDAIFVEYDHAFCEQYQIGRFGRKTVKDGKIQFHAGPKQVVHPSVYVMDDHNFLDYARQWREGAYCPVPIDKLMQGPKWPELIEPKRPKASSINYEQALFKYVSSQSGKPITLVNPSFSTMTALKSSVGGYVTLTSTGDHGWERDVLDFIQKSNGMLKMLTVRTVRGIAYLGADVPQWYPETQWFRLILSPFVVMNKEFPHFRVQFEPERVTTRYEKKKGYVVTSVLERDSPYYVINPVTIDKIVGRRDQWYFCEMNFKIECEHLDDVKVSHAPWFVTIPRDLDWEPVQIGREIRYLKRKDGVVYDVRGPGTWLSRRARTLIPHDHRWVSLEKKGTHWVTYTVTRPRQVYGVTVEQDRQFEVTLFDDARLIRKLDKIDLQGRVLTSEVLEGVELIRLPSDTELYEVIGSVTEEKLPFDKRVRDVVKTDTGQYFRCSELREDGACFVPGGQNYAIPGMGRGQIKPIQTIHTRVADYVVLPNYPGNKFLFPRAGDIEMMCSTISLFASDWISVAQQVSGNDSDAPLVSTDIVGQQILAAVTSVQVHNERDMTVTAAILSDRTGCSPSFIYRYMAVTSGFLVWKIEGGIIQFSHESCLHVRCDGVENLRTADGKKWVDILRGEGLKQRFQFISRKLRPLIRFLQWNYCMVNQVDRGEYVELVVRRPKYG